MKARLNRLFVSILALFAFGWPGSLSAQWNAETQWTNLTLTGVFFQDTTHGFISSAGGHIFRLNRITQTYDTIYAGPDRLNGLYFNPFFPVVGFAFGENGHLARTQNAGNQWYQVPQNSINWRAIHFLDIASGLIVGDSASVPVIKITHNLGSTWAPVSATFGSSFTVRSVKMLSINQWLVAGVISSNHVPVIFRTDNGGLNWTPVGPSISGLGFMDPHISLEAYSADTIWFATGNIVGNTQNGGANWTLDTLGANLCQLRKIWMDKSSGIGYVAGQDGYATSAIFKTTDFGQTWVSDHSQGYGCCTGDGYITDFYMRSATDGFAVTGSVMGGSFTFADGILYRLSGPSPCSGFSVSLGVSDTVTCANGFRPNPVIFGGSGDYNATWSPPFGIDDPYSLTPLFKNVNFINYTLYVQDNQTGCSQMVNITISDFSPVFDTLITCNTYPVALTLPYGGTSYSWSTGQMGQTLQASAPGTYFGYGIFPYCGAITSSFTVLDTCQNQVFPTDSVWPGDANFDGIADLYDVLNIGLAYGMTGPVRPNATNNWTPQACQDWTFSFATGPNVKHSDCNGDGVVDAIDVDVVAQNYGLTHQKDQQDGQQGNPLLYLEFDKDTAQPGDLVTVSFFLGESTQPLSSIHGVAFQLNYNPGWIDSTSFNWDFSPSWMVSGAASVIDFRYPVHSANRIDVVHSRTDRQNMAGHGLLGTLTYYIQDNIAGKDFAIFPGWMSLSGVKAIDSSGATIPLTVKSDSIAILYELTGLAETGFGKSLKVFPNPTRENLFLTTDHPLDFVRLTDPSGRVVLSVLPQSTDRLISVSTNRLSSGMYFLEVFSKKGKEVRKIQVLN